MHFIAHEARTDGEAAASELPKTPGQAVPDKPESRSETKTTTTAATAATGGSILTLAKILRWIAVDIPLLTVFCMLLSALLLRHVYQGTIQPMVEAYRRGDSDDDGYYSIFDNDLTYYNRQCDADDISTRDANDLLVRNEHTKDDVADIMMEHGAVVVKNVLSDETASNLRAYLETRNEIRDTLSWHEKFWYEIGRLALGLGAHDSPAITQALYEIGTNPDVKKTVEGILGPDPAIVEISTLTSVYGAHEQGIHSDSDYFGSSVMYARNFLHSYTMFMALQDTTSKMGATTLCPGTHHCANIDLEDVCMEEGNHFEASSNGMTGVEHGVWEKGDAMMFNQNVWHRGAANQDPDNPLNRVMLIMTFVTRNKATPSDRRQQAIGTYYYQRWNHWGHTYSDLANVDWLMTQPLIMLRAWGIWKLSGSNWGITWLEHFARQLANDEDFYAWYELEPFIQYLDSIGIPEFLQGTPDNEWEPFLGSMLENWIEFLAKVNAIAIGAYLALYTAVRLVLYLVSGSRNALNKRGTVKRQWVPGTIKRLLLTHGFAIALFAAITLYMDNTMIARRVKSGEINIRPFPVAVDSDDDEGGEHDTSACRAMLKDLKIGPSTFPERMDILVGTRFDAEWLAAYNRMLDYHPGNKRFQRLLDEVAATPLDEVEAARVLTKLAQAPVKGVSARFLFQNPADGSWSIMDKQEVFDITRKSLLAQRNTLIKSLWTKVREIQAEGRFGTLRDTKMAQVFTPIFVKQWERQLFGTIPSVVPDRSMPSPQTMRIVRPFNLTLVKNSFADLSRRSAVTTTTTTTTTPSSSAVAAELRVGDRVRANYNLSGRWLEGAIAGVYDSNRALVAFIDGSYANLSSKNIIRYRPYVQNDRVEVIQMDEDWRAGVITEIHPLGLHEVQYDNGGTDVVEVDFVRPTEFHPVSFLYEEPVDEELSEYAEDDDEDEDDDYDNDEEDDDDDYSDDEEDDEFEDY